MERAVKSLSFSLLMRFEREKIVGAFRLGRGTSEAVDDDDSTFSGKSAANGFVTTVDTDCSGIRTRRI